MSVTNNNNEARRPARPGRTYPQRPYRRSYSGLGEGSGRALGPRAGRAPPGLRILLSPRGQRQESGAAVRAAAARHPLPRAAGTEEREKSLLSHYGGQVSQPPERPIPRMPGFSLPLCSGVGDHRLSPDFQHQGSFTAPAAAPWSSSYPRPLACPLLFYSPFCLVSKASKGTKQTAGNKICRFSCLLCLLVSEAATAPRPQVSKQWVLFLSQVSSSASHDILPFELELVIPRGIQSLPLPHPDSGFPLANVAAPLFKGHCTPVIT